MWKPLRFHRQNTSSNCGEESICDQRRKSPRIGSEVHQVQGPKLVHEFLKIKEVRGHEKEKAAIDNEVLRSMQYCCGVCGSRLEAGMAGRGLLEKHARFLQPNDTPSILTPWYCTGGLQESMQVGKNGKRALSSGSLGTFIQFLRF